MLNEACSKILVQKIPTFLVSIGLMRYGQSAGEDGYFEGQQIPLAETRLGFGKTLVNF